MELEPKWVKLIGAVVSLILTSSFGWFAQIEAIRNRRDVLSMLNAGGGGVLMAIAIVHLLPDIAEAQEQSGVEYPLCYFFVILGYMLLLLLEKVLFSHEHLPDNVIVEHCHKLPDECTKLEPRGDSSSTPTSTLNFEESYEELEVDLATPLLLLASMSVHAFFEGLVFGMQSDATVAITFCIAIEIHKPVEALTLGGIMVKEGVSSMHYIGVILALSAATPIGVIVGISLHNLEIPPLVLGSLVSLTAGSFLYIATTEIISDEFHKHGLSAAHKWKIYMSFVTGVTFILLLEILMGSSHSHSH